VRRIVSTLFVTSLVVSFVTGCASNERFRVNHTAATKHAIRLVDRRPESNKKFNGEEVHGKSHLYQYGENNFEPSALVLLEDSMNKQLPFRFGTVSLTKLDLTLKKADNSAPIAAAVVGGSAGGIIGAAVAEGIVEATRSEESKTSFMACAFEAEFNGRHYAVRTQRCLQPGEKIADAWPRCIDQAVSQFGHQISAAWLE
jgi:hypothetical protein